MVNEQSKVVVASGLTAADLGGEAVLLDANSGRYFGLNEVGARILDLARQPQTIEEIVESLEAEFDVDRERLSEDVLVFVRQLVERRLLEVSNGASS